MYGYGKLVYNVLQQILGGGHYLPAHEDCIILTIATAVMASAAAAADQFIGQQPWPPFCILEVGMESDLHILHCGLYDDTLFQVTQSGLLINQIKITRLDVWPPNTQALTNTQ